ncbi:MAG: CGNR zinc finger domain-containing protein [Gammaproteobacteria bacterium]|nr:CGNR zinc finger domain-containing protein [Gammaproteobacteria bacterium]
MKKPLRQESEIFLSQVGGQIRAWDVSDEEILVEAANQGLRHSIEERTLIIPERIVFEEAVAQWLIRLLNEGVTESLIDELNKETSDIRYRRLLAMDEGGSPRWHEIADLDGDLEPESKAAYAISHLVGSGAFQRLGQCEEDACDRFFLGPPNRMWCSDRCGSRFRGREKRKLDRERGVLPGA